MKGKIILLGASIALLASLVVNACGKESGRDEIEARSMKSESTMFLNNSNQYDSVGIMHNNLICTFKNEMERMYRDGQEWTVPSSISLCNTILAANDYDTTFSREWAYYVVENCDLSLSRVVDSLPVSIYAKCLCEHYFNSLLRIGNSSDYTYHYAEAYRCCTLIEDSVIGNMLLTDIEKQVLLEGLSVYRHSLGFWSNETYDSVIYKEKPNWGKIGALALADLCGALKGAAEAAGSTIMTGPYGATGAAIVGGVVGGFAASGSAVAAINMVEKIISDDNPSQPSDTTSNPVGGGNN